MKKKKLLIVAQNFWPENFPINSISESLINNYSIDVITGQPNYPYGKIYKGYKWYSIRKEMLNNINIYRVPIIPRFSGTSINLIFNYTSFIISACLFGYFSIFKKKYNLVFVYAPSPILQSLVGIFYSKIKKIKLITWVQDLWPDVLNSTGHINNKYILKIVLSIVKYIYKKNDLLLVQSYEFKKNILSLNSEYNVEYLPNPGNIKYLDEQINNELIPHIKLINLFKNNFNIVYAGNIGTVQSLETIVKSAQSLNKFKDIKFYIIGNGRNFNLINKKIKKLKLKNVFLTGYINEKYMPLILNKSTLLYISLKNDEVLNSTIPSKFQNYLAAGKPILASISGETANIINECQCGVVCPPEDSIELSKAILKMKKLSLSILDSMGNNGKKYFLKHYHPNQVIDRLCMHINKLVN